MKPYFVVLLGTFLLTSFCRPAPVNEFDAFRQAFMDDYADFDVPNLQLSYVDYLQSLHQQRNVDEQRQFLESSREKLQSFTIDSLERAEDRTAYQILSFEIALNLQRVILTQQLQEDYPNAEFPEGGLSAMENGQAWYAHLLQRWLGSDANPEDIYEYGLQATRNVQAEIETIQQASGMDEDAFYAYLNDEAFFINDREAIQEAFLSARRIVREHLPELYHHPARVDLVNIAVGDNPALSQTPGYFQPTNGGTFYYNLFDEPYNLRQIDWLFIHEASPGHHFQVSIAQDLDLLPEQNLAFYSGYVEGYAAYTEEIGQELGLYRTPYDYLGKWEWDIVRSVRVVLDVALNYHGWTDEQALAFWRQNIRNQDQIAQREIDRMRRWPAQVVTYKYGAQQIQNWKSKWQDRYGENFDIRDFHERLLMCGPMPYPALEQLMLAED